MLRTAELGFLGLAVKTLTQTPRFCGQPSSSGLFIVRLIRFQGVILHPRWTWPSVEARTGDVEKGLEGVRVGRKVDGRGEGGGRREDEARSWRGRAEEDAERRGRRRLAMESDMVQAVEKGLLSVSRSSCVGRIGQDAYEGCRMDGFNGGEREGGGEAAEKKAKKPSCPE